MIVRIRHCIADGFILISVTMALVDGGLPPPAKPGKGETATSEDWLNGVLRDTLRKSFADTTVRALGAVGEGAARSLGMLAVRKTCRAG